MKTRIAVLGAGMSGLCMGMQLRSKGIDDFVILEKAAAVGGTWRENTYPNVACDVPSHVYSFSFKLNPNWSHSYSGGEEIFNYCESCVEDYGLQPFIRFGVEVTQVKFDGQHWQITTAAGENYTADVVVSGLGGLHKPNFAKIDGIESFQGDRFHTAQWDHDIDLAGKRIALIGTGASAAQTLPGIAPDAAQVSVFQRHAAWVFPRLAQDISDQRRDLFQRHPWLMRLYRWWLWGRMDLVGMLSLRRGGVLANSMRNAALKLLEESVSDPELRAKLTPDYEAGCKRRVIADDYLTTFNRDNVSLVTDKITGIEPSGVRDATGKLHEVDVVIEATGFKPFDISEYVDVIGREEQQLRDVWRERVDSLRTMMVPGFPNFFMMLGPNSATGHTSALIMIESAVDYVLKALQFMNESGVRHLDPDPQVVQRYNARLQRDMQKMVFSGGCGAWYTDDNDFNFTLWPYSAARFIFEQRRLDGSEFVTR